MAGFNSPSILFLNTWDKPERDWNGNLFRQAPASGYTRYVELYAGAFANCMVAVENGWEPEQIEACDVWAYTAALGYAYSGKPLTEMRATIDGSPVPLSGNAADDAATVIMAQYRMRLSKHDDIDYYRELLADLDINDSEHVGQLRERIAANMVRLGGLRYEPTDPMKYAERIMDDPHTIVFANPPTYPGAYEKFFDTGGRFQWAEPEYNVFNAPVDIPKLCKLFDGRKALLICQQQQTPGNAATDSPVYARRLGLDSVIYMNSNRPNEVKRLVGGNMVTVASSKSAEIPIPILPRDHRITERSEIKVVPLRDSAAQDSYLQVITRDVGVIAVLFATERRRADKYCFRPSSYKSRRPRRYPTYPGYRGHEAYDTFHHNGEADSRQRTHRPRRRETTGAAGHSDGQRRRLVAQRTRSGQPTAR